MNDTHKCMHEVDLALIKRSIENIEGSNEKILLSLNSMPTKVNLMWRFNWVLLVTIVIGVLGALLRGVVT